MRHPEARNESAAHILVYTLGPFSVKQRQPDGTYESVSLITSGPVTYESHTKSLLGYLLCCSGREAFRPTILDQLWGEKSDRVSIDEYMYRATSNVSRVLGGEPYFRRTHKKQRYILADQSQVWNDADHCEGLVEATKRVGPTTGTGSRICKKRNTTSAVAPFWSKKQDRGCTPDEAKWRRLQVTV